MLIYHPALDVNHCIFRMLRLLRLRPDRTIRWDAHRIIDMYYLFPYLLGDARLPQNLTKLKREFAAAPSRYNPAPSPKLFIHRMSGILEGAALSLANKGFVELDAFRSGWLTLTEKEIPKKLTDAFDAATADAKLVAFLAIEVAAIPLGSKGGLKERTGLLEYYYDAE